MTPAQQLKRLLVNGWQVVGFSQDNPLNHYSLLVQKDDCLRLFRFATGKVGLPCDIYDEYDVIT